MTDFSDCTDYPHNDPLAQQIFLRGASCGYRKGKEQMASDAGVNDTVKRAAIGAFLAGALLVFAVINAIG